MKRIYNIVLFLVFLAFTLNISGQDKLSNLRTSKKIIPTELASAPYYAIQILALKEPPGNAAFFTKIENAREWSCKDEFVRYTVGEFETAKEAAIELENIKQLGYDQAFVVNTKRYQLGESIAAVSIDPNKRYTVQLSAFRFPVYLSYFKEYSAVQEYYLKDKIYRYCVGDVLGSESNALLEEAKANGYKKAFLVPIEKYEPYKIE